MPLISDVTNDVTFFIQACKPRFSSVIKARPMAGAETPPLNTNWGDGALEWGTQDCHPHRLNDKPAFVWPGTLLSWWVNGKRHRSNGKPAIVATNGSREWFVNGRRHRESDKPAVVWSGGTRAWFVDGKLHRDGGNPALIDSDGETQWWVRGVCVRKSHVTNFTTESLRFGFLTAVCHIM